LFNIPIKEQKTNLRCLIELQGLPRLLEALESGEWDASGSGETETGNDMEDLDMNFDLDADDDDFDIDTILGLRGKNTLNHQILQDSKPAAGSERPQERKQKKHLFTGLSADLDLEKEIEEMMASMNTDRKEKGGTKSGSTGMREPMLRREHHHNNTSDTASTSSNEKKKKPKQEDPNTGKGAKEKATANNSDSNSDFTFEEDEEEENEFQDADVQNLQHMLTKLQAVRDMGSDLSEQDRRKLAARTVREVMKM
jgi:hypothetical protein